MIMTILDAILLLWFMFVFKSMGRAEAMQQACDNWEAFRYEPVRELIVRKWAQTETRLVRRLLVLGVVYLLLQFVPGGGA
jgi:hypothetical protein